MQYVFCVRIQTVLCAIKQTQGTVRHVRHDISHCLHNRLHVDRKVSWDAFQLCCSSMVVWCVGLSRCSYPMSGPVSFGLNDHVHIRVTFAPFYCEFSCQCQSSWLPGKTDHWNDLWLFTYHNCFFYFHSMHFRIGADFDTWKLATILAVHLSTVKYFGIKLLLLMTAYCKCYTWVIINWLT